MRDINRIGKCIKAFVSLWQRLPDLRFGQLVVIIANKIGKDLFYIEDDEFFAVVEKIEVEYEDHKESTAGLQ